MEAVATKSLKSPTPSLASRSMTSSMCSSAGESVRVVVRCRPLTRSETAQGYHSIVSTNSARGIVEVQHPSDPSTSVKCFSFDAVYGHDSDQPQLYREIFAELVDSTLNGFNSTIFAYGQTGSGKTYTMDGEGGHSQRCGVIPSAVGHIFNYIAQQPIDRKYLVRASYMEIYQEELRDLLNSDSKKRLELRERLDTGVYVRDLSSYVTKSVEEMEYVMAVGNSNRSVGRTNMNEHSSRSHAIFIITVECSEQVGEHTHIRVGRLNLVDLAGSERQTKAGTNGRRFKEATKINLALSTLGNVISALVEQKGTHVPYRDSKLTRLLQDSLGGNARTVMVACVGPASYNYEETVNTLRYASRARRIQNRPRVNEDPKDALIREYQGEIERLQALLMQHVLEQKHRCDSCTRRRRRQRREKSCDLGVRPMPPIPPAGSLMSYSMEGNNSSRISSQIHRESARCSLASEMEESEKELEKERRAQAALSSKIAIMQSKLLFGGGGKGTELMQHTADVSPTTPRHRVGPYAVGPSSSGETEEEEVSMERRLAELQLESALRTKGLRKLHCKLQRFKADAAGGCSGITTTISNEGTTEARCACSMYEKSNRRRQRRRLSMSPSCDGGVASWNGHGYEPKLLVLRDITPLAEAPLDDSGLGTGMSDTSTTSVALDCSGPIDNNNNDTGRDPIKSHHKFVRHRKILSSYNLIAPWNEVSFGSGTAEPLHGERMTKSSHTTRGRYRESENPIATSRQCLAGGISRIPIPLARRSLSAALLHNTEQKNTSLACPDICHQAASTLSDGLCPGGTGLSFRPPQFSSTSGLSNGDLHFERIAHKEEMDKRSKEPLSNFFCCCAVLAVLASILLQTLNYIFALGDTQV